MRSWWGVTSFHSWFDKLTTNGIDAPDCFSIDFLLVERSHDRINNDASILVKVAIDEDLGEVIKVMIIAFGLEASTVF